MKTPPIVLALLLSALPCLAQFAGVSAAYRGNYFGIMIPSAKCSNERLGIDITIDSDGNVSGEMRDWENYPVDTFSANWPLGVIKGRFNVNLSVFGDGVKGTANKSGSLRGIATLNGCRYTFVAYRRFKVAQ